MDGIFPMPGHDRPVAMLLLFSYDPFQKLVRVAILDDLVGLLDGFAGSWQGSELVVTNLACDSRFHGANSRLTLAMQDADRFEIRSDVSMDRGKTWKTSLVAAFRRQ